MNSVIPLFRNGEFFPSNFHLNTLFSAHLIRLVCWMWHYQDTTSNTSFPSLFNIEILMNYGKFQMNQQKIKDFKENKFYFSFSFYLLYLLHFFLLPNTFNACSTFTIQWIFEKSDLIFKWKKYICNANESMFDMTFWYFFSLISVQFNYHLFFIKLPFLFFIHK